MQMTGEHSFNLSLLQQIIQPHPRRRFENKIISAAFIEVLQEKRVMHEQDRWGAHWPGQLAVKELPHLFFASETTAEQRGIDANDAYAGLLFREPRGSQRLLISFDALSRDGPIDLARVEFVPDVVIARNKENRRPKSFDVILEIRKFLGQARLGEIAR